MYKKPGEGILTFNTTDTHKEGMPGLGRGWVATVAGKLSCVTCIPDSPRDFTQTWPPVGSEYPRRIDSGDAVELAQLHVIQRAVAVCQHLRQM